MVISLSMIALLVGQYSVSLLKLHDTSLLALRLWSFLTRPLTILNVLCSGTSKKEIRYLNALINIVNPRKEH